MSAPDRFEHEQRVIVLARHGQSVRRRWAFAALGVTLATIDFWLDEFPYRPFAIS